MLKVLIVDDEPGARLALKALLEQLPHSVRLVGTAATALEGIKLIQQEKPDLVLLDIEMPHGSGFDLLEAIPDRKFHVVYTTAHEQHAVRAAHTHPFDYLLKPVDPDELERCLDQLTQREEKPAPKRIEISSMNGKVFLRIKDIVRVEADGGYSTVHTVDGEKHVASKSIGHFEERLPKEKFFRCHNSHLVNLDKVKGWHQGDGGMVTMHDRTQVPIATRRLAEFQQRTSARG